MTTHRDTDLDTLLDAWMGPGPRAIPERLLAAVADDVARLPQRRWKGAIRRLSATGTRARFTTEAGQLRAGRGPAMGLGQRTNRRQLTTRTTSPATIPAR